MRFSERTSKGYELITDEDVERIATRTMQKVWEYSYRNQQGKWDNPLGGDGSKYGSNRYNVMNATYEKAKAALEKLEQLLKKLDK